MTPPTTRQLRNVLGSVHLLVNGTMADTRGARMQNHRGRAAGFVDALRGYTHPYQSGSYRMGHKVGTYFREHAYPEATAGEHPVGPLEVAT